MSVEDIRLLYLRRFILISTGSESLDDLLGGGIRSGMITDVYGESGSGKTQLCFTLAVNCAKNGDRVLFVDTAGTFRPERILEIGTSREVLEKITYLRAFGTADQVSVVQKIPQLDPQLLIIDTVTSLFSAEYSGPSRHLAIMKHLHDLAISAMASHCAVVITNMVRNVPATVIDQAGRNVAQAIIPSQQREYLGSSVSIYSHFKLKLEIVDARNSVFRAVLVQPPGKDPATFGITSRGISEIR
ncbi:MAG TPA: ATPase domain-containing protein [Nitrososphaera sp.]|nr:ATPase domain-containing protein [Nitrososphaera sp.]